MIPQNKNGNAETHELLNGAQIQSLIDIVRQYEEKKLSENQATNIMCFSMGMTKEQAKDILKGTR